MSKEVWHDYEYSVRSEDGYPVLVKRGGWARPGPLPWRDVATFNVRYNFDEAYKLLSLLHQDVGVTPFIKETVVP